MNVLIAASCRWLKGVESVGHSIWLKHIMVDYAPRSSPSISHPCHLVGYSPNISPPNCTFESAWYSQAINELLGDREHLELKEVISTALQVFKVDIPIELLNEVGEASF